MTAPFLPSHKINSEISSALGNPANTDSANNHGDSSVAPERIYQWVDSIPGAIAQITTTTTGVVVCCPYMSAGCFKLLEVPMSVSVKERNSLHQPSIESFFDVIHPEKRRGLR